MKRCWASLKQRQNLPAQNCAGPAGAALCRDGLRSSPGNLCNALKPWGCFAAHRDTRPLLQGPVQRWVSTCRRAVPAASRRSSRAPACAGSAGRRSARH
ncbi:hypothetical protein CXG50_24290 [Pseudomonas plecoglossicida]|uniref:Uncharacterized protein n=1 Tax=Pseudomonas plecoglossicida TaxID=70775 RepID=A0ABX4TUP4_PSEDL|nr:hypothetical protein CSW00_14080 [Pseudomonas sp. MR 02]PLP87955.1 hypothetical protein CX682_22525 [Pseudomonas sp. FFUP_PS_41]PLU84702.1 hypothetical protein CXG44_24675 [Pseudomonas plecoglossicida]TXI04277.1 MAG: hypothetical protein E6Q70_13700 [Pseudomonas monteilii]PLU90040.1 hypothetical protein CXG45_25265 [Pseudomonas plecoglossicida]